MTGLARRFELFVTLGLGASSLTEVTSDGVRLFVEADSPEKANALLQHLREFVAG